MNLKKVIQGLDAEVISEGSGLSEEIEEVCASDLMSDVLSYGKSHSLLLTSLTNPHTVRTAEITELSAICFVHGKQPQPETIELAKQSDITVLRTKLSMFDACGKLYGIGLKGCDSGT